MTATVVAADQAAERELAKRAATVPKLPESLLADIRNDPTGSFEAFELRHRARDSTHLSTRLNV